MWGVVVLKALNGILIPATFKYADNILYAYAKPSSIVVTTVLGSLLAQSPHTCMHVCIQLTHACALHVCTQVLGSLLAQSLPAPSLLLGVGLVVGSIFLYSSKPKDQ